MENAQQADLPIVYIVDDEPAVRDALGLLLQSVGLAHVGFSDAHALLEYPLSKGPCCLITDLRMPLMSGIELVETLRGNGASIPAIVISGHGDIRQAVRALKCGATDFLEKPFDDQDLLDAVNSALNLPCGSDRIQAVSDDMAARIGQITPRELAVLKQIIAGRPNKLIARKLDLSPRTVEAHRARVMQKMQAGSVAELVSLALRAGIAPDRDTA